MSKIKLTGGLELDLTQEQKKELIAQLGAKESKVWKPEMGDKYWCINPFGVSALFHWDNDQCDNFRLSIGNCFKEKSEAEEALKTGWVAKLQARKRLDDYIAEKGYDIDVDWEDMSQTKYWVYFCYGGDKLIGEFNTRIKYNDLPYFKKQEDRDDVFENFREEYKILLGVK